MPMLSPVRDGKTGTLSQVQACQRQVSELRASLSLLAERCGCLEDVHKGAIERLRDFGSPKPGATLEQLKKQSMAKVKALQSRHGELMSKLQEELSLSCERSEPTPTTEKLKTPAVLKGAAGVPSPDLAKPEAVNGAGVAAPLTLESENGHEQTDVSSVTVMPIDGRVGKLNSRLRFHDIQAKSAPDRLTPQGLPMARSFPGAEPCLRARGPHGPPLPPSDRVEEIRRRAAEIEKGKRASAALSSAESPVTPRVPETDASRSPISDVWARFHPSRGGDSGSLLPMSAPGDAPNANASVIQEPTTFPSATAASCNGNLNSAFGYAQSRVFPNGPVPMAPLPPAPPAGFRPAYSPGVHMPGLPGHCPMPLPAFPLGGSCPPSPAPDLMGLSSLHACTLPSPWSSFTHQ